MCQGQGPGHLQAVSNNESLIVRSNLPIVNVYFQLTTFHIIFVYDDCF